MPNNLIDSVVNTCNMSRKIVEEKWQEAKEKANNEGHKENWKYITTIFKSLVSKECAKKMNWNKNEEKTIIMNVNKLLEKIDFYLREEKKNVDWEDVWEALVTIAKEIFGDEYNVQKVEDIFDAIKKKKPKDTEDAIGIGKGMLRTK